MFGRDGECGWYGGIHIIIGQSLSWGARNPVREYHAWWSQKMYVEVNRQHLKKIHGGTVTTRLYHCLIHSYGLHLPKTKSVVSGTASFISTGVLISP
jgi:hypothetical protein